MLGALIDLGAKPNARKGEALAVAVGYRKSDVVKMLLRREARLDGAFGQKAAASLGYGNKPLGDLVARLVAGGLDPALIPEHVPG